MNLPDVPSTSSEDRLVPTDDTSFAEVLSDFERQRARELPPATRQGSVISIRGDQVMVDIGRKTEGVLNADHVRDRAGHIKVQPGDTVTVTITGRDPDGYYLLSTATVVTPRDWAALEKAFAAKAVISGVVEEAIKGGLRVDVGVRAFLPASRSGARDADGLAALVGQQIRCRITKLDVADEDVVVDRRSVIEEEETRVRQERFETLKEGDVVTGVVESLAEYGAFVDLGGFDGLLHIGDMAWHRVSKPEEVVQTGDSIQVRILKIDPAAHKLSLGLKQLSADPWLEAAGRFPEGSRVRGTVSRVTDFGAFVELEPGIEGLIHVSEMSWSKKARKPADMVRPGEIVEVAVLGVNASERRISLGLKQTLGDPWQEAARKYPPGTIVEGSVTNLAKFGAFVEIEEGIEGMVHIADIQGEKRLSHPKDVLAVGRKVRAVVLELDQARRRLKLGMRQLDPSDADEYIDEHRAGDLVSGRIVEIAGGQAKVELGQGVFGHTRITEPIETSVPALAPGNDLASLTALLSSKWKSGGAPAEGRSEAPRQGQIRQFRIRSLDAAGKQIELELAG